MDPLVATDVHLTWPGGTTALRGVSLSVPAGSTAALVGESGSGKTTLLKCFNRLAIPDTGQVLFEGEDTGSGAPERLRRRIGYVAQEGGLLPHWNVRRNVELVPALLGWDAARRLSRSNELLDLVGLPPAKFADRYPSTLSGGQSQRVAFARALAADPDVLLLDEPFGGLDALRRLELQEEVRRWQGELGKTILFVTHDLAGALRLADTIHVLRDGRILQSASPAGLRAAPADPFVADLLRAAGVEQ